MKKTTTKKRMFMRSDSWVITNKKGLPILAVGNVNSPFSGLITVNGPINMGDKK